MEFFCYHRDRPGSTGLRHRLLEEHWSYMDQFASRFIARGPTFTDNDLLTGSVHIIELPDPVTARSFAFDEPGYQAGAYRDVMLRRWRNRLGRTMWDYSGDRDGNAYLVVGLGSGVEDDTVPADRDALIAYGPLLSDEGTTWLGTAAIVQAPAPSAARDILSAERYADVEVHNWTFGGRR